MINWRLFVDWICLKLWQSVVQLRLLPVAQKFLLQVRYWFLIMFMTVYALQNPIKKVQSILLSKLQTYDLGLSVCCIFLHKKHTQMYFNKYKNQNSHTCFFSERMKSFLVTMAKFTLQPPKNDTSHRDNWKAALLFGNRFVLKWRHSFTDSHLIVPCGLQHMSSVWLY